MLWQHMRFCLPRHTEKPALPALLGPSIFYGQKAPSPESAAKRGFPAFFWCPVHKPPQGMLTTLPVMQAMEIGSRLVDPRYRDVAWRGNDRRCGVGVRG